MTGLSPLTRGTHRRERLRQSRKRFIPAHAGNTAQSSIGTARHTVYPRSRGEHAELLDAAAQNRGLSPLTRGTQQPERQETGSVRFIPAHAGNTPAAPVRHDARPVYPRSRGEHNGKPQLYCRLRGLSPLTRGTLPPLPLERQDIRFIPAHAGNTSHASALRRGLTVYPRSRGEHHLPFVMLSGTSGLSPLTRGTPAARRRVVWGLRFIPAHAGNTTTTRRMASFIAVYPRSRGEHPIIPWVGGKRRGLSPLTRGTLADKRGFRGILRFIPAHAGNTTWRRRHYAMQAVYPRSRGEHAYARWHCRRWRGLSPLTRGTLLG